MKKLIVNLLVFSVISFALLANGVSESQAQGSAEVITLKVFDYADATTAGYEETEALWEKFDEDNSDIVLEKENLSNEPFHQKLAAYVAAGTIPDIVYMYPGGRSADIHKQKLLKDLKPLLGDEFLSNFLPAVVDSEDQAGHYLAMLPVSICYSSVMYVNEKLLNENGLEVPKTYEDLKAMVPKLKAKGIQTVVMANKDDWVMQSCLYSTIAGRFVGKDWFGQVVEGKVKFTDKEFVDSLRFVDTLYKDGVISRDTIQLSYGEVPGLFAAGKAAILIDGDWRQSVFLTDKASGEALISPEKQQSDIVLEAFPVIPGEKYPGVVSSTLGCGYGISASIPSGSAKEAAVLKLFKYIYSKEVQKTYLELGKYITSRTDVVSDSLEPLTLKMKEYYASVPETCFVLDSVLDPAIYTVINKVLQEIGLGTKTPEQGAAEIQQAADAWIASN
ncbi:MAG: extracellular solute-binding protein [Candidatus Cloacimonetes bacterium]|nr:extracellular solute-binding protein [Candidatus Cloacimonadota bacterium]